MYYSINQLAPGPAAELAALPSAARTGKMLAGQSAEVAFETTIASMAAKTGHNPIALASEVLSRSLEWRRKSIEIGAAELVSVFEGEKTVQNFLGQVGTPKARLRFESVGGIQDDVIAARNRASAMAYVALSSPPAKSQYVEHLKSLRKLVTGAVDSGLIGSEVGQDLVADVEQAALSGLTDMQRDQVAALHGQARNEILEEVRQRLRAQYARVARPDDTPTP